jgi:hypothetical protein
MGVIHAVVWGFSTSTSPFKYRTIMEARNCGTDTRA